MNWRPNDAEPPPRDKLVLTLWDGVDAMAQPVRYYDVLIFDAEHREWITCDGDYACDPTHWMPLPEPPK